MRLSTKQVRRKTDGEIVTINESDLQRPEIAELYDPVAAKPTAETAPPAPDDADKGEGAGDEASSGEAKTAPKKSRRKAKSKGNG